MRTLVLMLAVLVSQSLWGAPLTVTYPAPVSDKDVRYAYAIDLLKLVLDNTGGDYVLKPSAMPMTQSRIINDLKDGSGRIDVAWLQTSKAREAELLPVRFPIYKGFIGWRLLLIRAGDQERFDGVSNLSDLAKLKVALGHDWPDVTIMGSAGLPVEKNASYDGIFLQLASGRVDYLSRSVLEIGLEAKAHASEGVVIEKGLMLHYPGAFYFFFSPSRPELAERVRTGLLRAHRDGSFEKLFQRHWARIIDDAHLDRRRVIPLQNPLFPEIPPEVPLNVPSAH